MQILVKPSKDSLPAAPAIGERIDTAAWLRYFQDNKRSRMRFDWRMRPDTGYCCPALVRSLQRFQLGETGDGKYLKKFAAQAGDADYAAAISLFIIEEQEHAQLLAQAIEVMGGTIIRWHWSSAAFVLIRRLLGLRTEVLTLQVAEIIGRCFYERLRDRIGDEFLQAVFAQMVVDEVSHTRFHAEYIRSTTSDLPVVWRAVLWCALTVLFFAACLAFVLDHGPALRELGCGKRQFFKEAAVMFQKATGRALRLD